MPGARHQHFVPGDVVELVSPDYIGLPVRSMGTVLRQSERLVLVLWIVGAHRRWADAEQLKLLIPA